MALFVAKIRRTIVEIFNIPIAAENLDAAQAYLREHGDSSDNPWYCNGGQGGGLDFPDETESDTTAVIEVAPVANREACPFDTEGVYCYNEDDVDVTIGEALAQK